jgi:hypothetical protein
MLILVKHLLQLLFEEERLIDLLIKYDFQALDFLYSQVELFLGIDALLNER